MQAECENDNEASAVEKHTSRIHDEAQFGMFCDTTYRTMTL